MLDFKKLEKLYDKNNIDLAARSDLQGNGLPVLAIYNKSLSKNNVFISIRPKPDNNKTKTIRNLIQKGADIRTMVPESVHEYIQKKKLYHSLT